MECFETFNAPGRRTSEAEINNLCQYLDCFVGVHDEGNEEGQDDVDEQRDKRVEVDAREPPDQHGTFAHSGESGKHVVSVDQREQALGRRRDRLKLRDSSTRPLKSLTLTFDLRNEHLL